MNKRENQYITAKKCDIERLIQWIKVLTIVIVLNIFWGVLRAEELANRPDIRPLDNSEIVRIVRGFTRFHAGIDYACYVDSKVMATADGEVVLARYVDGFGNCIKIKHNWVKNGKNYTGYTVYGHLQEFKVLKGQKVYKRQVIALSGNTGRSEGAHLHYQLENENETPIWNGTWQAKAKNEH